MGQLAQMLPEKGFIVVPGPFQGTDLDKAVAAYERAVACADSEDIRVGSTSIRASSILARAPELAALLVHRPQWRQRQPRQAGRAAAIEDWCLLSVRANWARGFGEDWSPGEAEGLRKLDAWSGEVCRYEAHRDRPAEEDTSRLSPHLHFGELSPRQLYQGVAARHGAIKFLKELAWRDFTAGVIVSEPDYADRNGRPRYDRLPWRHGVAAKRDLDAWRQGRTGYPIVDAGMRQLWTTGWMHNRVRMIAASFLVKHLLIDWREGERWFWDCLVDADYGNNSVNWQWVAGTGIDSNMFGRIMAPLSQSEKFEAAPYIRQWVPELAHLPDDAIHDPEEAGLLPENYPPKIIGHREGRERALAAVRGIE